ncbi:DUF3048 domain-containing protein [Paenibacillus sp. CAU 1782]
MSKRYKGYITALFAFIMIVGTACAGGTTTPQESSSPSPPITDPTPSPEPTPMPYAAPLTGIQRETEASERPIAVMINNFSAARPQSGLSNADIVWEVLAEGGITRLVAIFQSTDKLEETVGPIRSNRAYLIDIADSYGAVMAHAGGSPEAYGILQGQHKPYLDEITNAGSAFWRSKDRKAPHNLYSDLDKLRSAAEKKKYGNEEPLRSYPFAATAEQGTAIADAKAEEAKEINVSFLLKSYNVGYTYDEATGLYLRDINGEPHIDLNNSEQLSAANLIVFETSHKTLDDVGRLAVDLKAGGPAYLFQGGKKIDIEWLRASDGMVRFIKDGSEISLVPGKTYIHVVPSKPALQEHVTWVQKTEEGNTSD